MIENQNIVSFYRDDRISDLIGFEYSQWHADDAVANLIHNLKEISQVEAKHPDRIVSIILDGENAWEHYPNNGYYFLNALYKQLSIHPEIELTTYSTFLAENPTQPQVLNKLVSGSWVYGTLSTWIGSKDKNRGWDMLCDAKQCFDDVVNNKTMSAEQYDSALKQLAICEGSDWFWWFGDYNSSDSVSDFEKLYRDNLSNLYKLLDRTAPEYLSSSFTFGHGTPEGGGSMRRSE
jgi:alpha-amylase/alpha-mannosidase (GH57 family)